MNTPTPPTDGARWKFLFVNTKEHDTTMLTKNLPVEVIHTPDLQDAEKQIKSEPVKGVFIDAASATPEEISKIKQSHDTTVVILADIAQVPQAIQHVRNGAQGFLVKGISDSESVLKLMQFADQTSSK